MRPSSALALRARVIAAFLATLAALVLREYVVNIRPHTVAWAAGQHLLGYWRTYGVIACLLAVVFPLAILLAPVLATRFAHLAARWRPWCTAVVLATTGIALCALILLWTNRQFGAFDESIVVDTLWRQHLGQRAYRDFLTTNPPLFVLGLRLAGWLFGVSWNAQAYLLCAFTLVTLPWTYALLRHLCLGRAPSLLLTVSAQVSGIVVLSFWWFNSTTAVVSGLFLLSALALLHREQSRFAQGSFVASLALLAWTKANSAGLLSALLVGVLLLFTRHRLRLAALVAASVALSAAALLLCGIAPATILASYAGVARSRGLTFLAFTINPFFTAEIAFQLLCLTVITLGAAPAFLRAIRARNRVAIAQWLLLLCGAAVGVFALASNGDIADVALAPVVLAIGVLAFGTQPRARWVPVFATGLFCAMLCTQLYKAESRLRIRLTGPYFAEEAVPVHLAFFHRLQTGRQMNRVALAAGTAVQHEPGPIFFTSRMEWAYAAFNLPSPTGLPVFYQSGTSFAPADEPKLLDRWKSLHFQTVIQPGRLDIGAEDWIAFPPSFQQALATGYTRDATTYPGLVIWRRHQP